MDAELAVRRQPCGLGATATLAADGSGRRPDRAEPYVIGSRAPHRRRAWPGPQLPPAIRRRTLSEDAGVASPLRGLEPGGKGAVTRRPLMPAQESNGVPKGTVNANESRRTTAKRHGNRAGAQLTGREDA